MSSRGHHDIMLYLRNQDLPAGIRSHLPEAAQEMYRCAFNSCWDSHRITSGALRARLSHEAAWATVKRSYEKCGTEWIERAVTLRSWS